MKTSSKLTTLSRDDKRKLLAHLLEQCARKTKLFPLSFAQQRMWFLGRLEPGDHSYNIPIAVRLRGELEVEGLEWTVSEIVRRHEVLRTTFKEVQGAAVQVVGEAEGVRIEVEDLRGLGETEREEEVRRRAEEEAGRPFDLEAGPLLRVRLLQLGAEEHVLLVTMHHIVSDGWSMSILIEEASALYGAYLKGAESPLAELGIQYADYAAWQREWLQGAELERELGYWREQLRGAAPVLEMPTDYARPAVQSSVGAAESFAVSAEVTAGLKQLSRRAGVTLFMTLVAAFEVLLYRYSGQGDISIGTPIAGRTRAEVEGLIGLFVNTLVLRNEVSGEESFGELLGRVREVCLGAYSHQELPFEKLVEELEPERSMSHTPLFQVMFVLQNTRRAELKLGEVSLSPLAAESWTAKFDLTLGMSEEGAGLAAVLEYNTELYRPETIRRMGEHLQQLLQSVVADPERKIWELELLTSEERRQLLQEWNDTGRVYPTGRCVHELFAARAEEVPEQVAVVYAGAELSYEELNRRANQVGHYLRRLGVGPEVRVGIFLERSLEMMVGLLGILKAGGAYVPLDPNYPRERVSYMIGDAAVSVLVSSEGLLGQLPEVAAAVVCLDRDWELIGKESEANLETKVLPENLAYVIYTSGSTGQPKGVMIQHREIANYVHAIIDKVKLEFGLRAAMVQPLTVDASQTVIFPVLCMAGTIHLIARSLALDSVALSDYFLRHQIELLKIAPSHLAALQVSARSEELLPRRWLIIGGEASRAEWVEQLRTMAPGCGIFNHYGPTEATVAMLTFPVPEKSSFDYCSENLPMGRPLANTRAYVLDGHLQPVPAGVPGELYIGGDCLARGYLNRPDKTAEKFIPDPFIEKPGARLYGTGDVVRYLSEGNLLFMGRHDRQVKIRGFRIELGEIEATLRTHPYVQDAIVLLRDDGHREKQLVGYVLSSSDSDDKDISGILLTYLREKLPGHMIPRAVVKMNAWPLSAHGKIDQRALPPPAMTALEGDEDFVAPETAIEQQVTEIWEEVLGVQPISVTANFFALGGHSLLATRVVYLIDEQFKINLPLRKIFEAPTIAGLSSTIEATIIEEVENLTEDEVREMLTLS